MEVPHEQWRPISEIIDQFTAMGYQVRGREVSDSLHPVEAIDLHGTMGHVHPVSGPAATWRNAPGRR
jgi:hypothetical protein